ncbi:MAG: sodium:proton antiporter [Betaproteobacteria bacterium HGW-Betaproteobacteria-21]|nr:MAG: sodium:proton antiporter [Betaproteobacteria bacterium HGW-Betaproteobacteria-21]
MSRKLLAALLSLTVTLALALALIYRPLPTEDLPARVGQAMQSSGVAHPVTAVLLNFRSYDTLLEVGVLLIAVVVALALREAQPDGPDRMGLDNPLLRAITAWLMPLMLMVAGYLLWAGSTRPGGAFQAGAVLAACGVLLRLCGTGLGWLEQPWRLRAGLALGPLVFLVVGTATMLAGSSFLAYPAPLAGVLILFIELNLMVSIALALVSLFRLAPPQSDSPHFADRRRSRRE